MNPNAEVNGAPPKPAYLQTVCLLVTISSAVVLVFLSIDLIITSANLGLNVLLKLLICISTLGTISGIGLLFRRNWARISMLVFSGLLILCGLTFGTTAILMPHRDPSSSRLLLARALAALIFAAPAVIGVLGIIFFTRKSVRFSFERPMKLEGAAIVAENLLPLAAYQTDDSGYWRRSPVVSGLLFGVWMGIFAAVFPLDDSNLLYSRTTRIAISFFSGLIFGPFFTLLTRWWTRLIQTGLYSGKSWIDVPPPANIGVNYRIVCSLIKGRIAVGGVAYLHSEGVIFAPHKRNRATNKRLLEMKPLRELRFDTAVLPVRNQIQRILIPRPQPVLVVQWPDGDARFVVPCAASLALKLTELAKTLVSPV